MLTHYPHYHLSIGYPRITSEDIVLASSVHLSGIIFQNLSVIHNAFLVQMISIMSIRYPINLVKIDSVTFELYILLDSV